MKLLKTRVGRRVFLSSLQFMRDRLASKPDYQHLRALAARLDQFTAAPVDYQTQPVVIGEQQATWIRVSDGCEARVVLYLHGGAFITETPQLHSALVARICKEARARALMPSYRLAPEHPFPAAIDDCVAAYRFLLDSGVDAASIVVAGDSAGGNLALVLLLRARDENLPLPAAVVTLSPLTDGSFGGDSIQRNNGHDPMFVPGIFEACGPLYMPDQELARNPYLSPLFGDLTSLPPVLMMVGSSELLLDDSVRFAGKCPSATLEVWHDMPHIFPAFDFLPEAVEATRRIGRFIRQHIAVDLLEIESAQASKPTAVQDREGRGVAAWQGAGHRRTDSFWPPAPALQTLAYWLLAAIAAIAAIALPLFSASGHNSVAGLLAGLSPTLPAASLAVWLGSATVLLFAAFSADRLGWPRTLLVMGVSLTLGEACGLALLLALRTRRE